MIGEGEIIMENIKAKVIIITGASSGIGEVTSKFLAQNGARVVLAARREERLKIIVNEIKKYGGEAVFKQTDVTSAEDMQKLAQFALEQYGRIDVIINNAGIMPNSPLNELKIQEWDQMIDVNIKGVLYGIASVLPTMRDQQSGHIINISSLMGHKVIPNTAVYSATKFAVRAITEGLRQEESPGSSIRTTNISPGMTATDVLSKYQDYPSISPQSIARAIAFSINEPDDTGVNEMVIRPTLQSV
jgi:NADP-dependent 3-hydroxy acid dehydrogenase YdfG